VEENRFFEKRKIIDTRVDVTVELYMTAIHTATAAGGSSPLSSAAQQAS
jgi:hypothetical protein